MTCATLSKDDRFHAVATETTRESLFFDFCEEFKKREERKKRSKRMEAKDAFVMFLKEKEEEGSLTFASTWNSFLSVLRDEDKSDARFVTSAAMTDSDRQLYFADVVIELQAAEDDKRNRIRGARRRAEKAQREAFEQALHGLATDGTLTPFSKWRTSEDSISALGSFGPVQDQDRDAPAAPQVPAGAAASGLHAAIRPRRHGGPGRRHADRPAPSALSPLSPELHSTREKPSGGRAERNSGGVRAGSGRRLQPVGARDDRAQRGLSGVV